MFSKRLLAIVAADWSAERMAARLEVLYREMLQ